MWLCSWLTDLRCPPHLEPLVEPMSICPRFQRHHHLLLFLEIYRLKCQLTISMNSSSSWRYVKFSRFVDSSLKCYVTFSILTKAAICSFPKFPLYFWFLWYSQLSNVRLIEDGGRAKGYGYAEFADRQSLVEALAMDETVSWENILFVVCFSRRLLILRFSSYMLYVRLPLGLLW